jgi:serine protease AprX
MFCSKPEKNKLLGAFALIFLLFSGNVAQAQNKKFVVYFKNKQGGNPFSISNPGAFLAPRSIQRRISQNLPIDSTDLPVTPSYLNGLNQAGASVLYPLRWLNGAIIDCPISALSNIEALPFVISSKPLNSKIRSSLLKKKNADGIQTLDYGISANQNVMLGMDSMHAMGFHGEGKLIAVMDAGFLNVNNHVAFAHLFAQNKIAGTRDLVDRDGDVYQDHWHGGAVLSNIGAKMPGQLYGGAFESSFYLIRTEDVASENEIECAYLVAGLELADSIGADIVNSSLGYTTFDTPSLDYNYNTLNGSTSLASKAAGMAASKGIVVVSSAGNEGSNNSWGGYISVPSDAENILTAGSVNEQQLYSSFSGKGPTADGRIKPDLVARGGSAIIANLFSNNGITSGNGTSFSAPIITGLVAGYWQAHPGLTALQVINNLKNTASNKENPNNLIGWGIPSFIKAHILAGGKPVLSFPFEIKIYPNPASGNEISIELIESSSSGPAEIALFDAQGKKVFQTSIRFELDKEISIVPLRGIASGVYLLNMEMGGKKFSRKILLN